MPYAEMDTITAAKLRVIAAHATRDPHLRFTSLTHHLDADYLLACFRDLKRGKAPGIDGRAVESYSEDEMATVATDIMVRMKAGTYRPHVVKRVYISKDSGRKLRPLGLPTIEDKVVQQTCRNILEAIWEADFLDCSYGYRPRRDAHTALVAVNHMIMQEKVNWILDADIAGFFDYAS